MTLLCYMKKNGYSYSQGNSMDYKNVTQENFKYLQFIQTRWRDMDAIGHINHAIYLTYFETVRVNYLNELGFDLLKRGMDKGVILASMKIDYWRQSTYPSNFNIGCRIIRIGHKSFDLFSAIFDDSETRPITSGIFTLVTFDYKLQKTISITDNIKNNYLPF